MEKPTILCVANWDSDVGYAWWLMESFWAEIARHYDEQYHAVIAYPSISKIPDEIAQSQLEVTAFDFVKPGIGTLFERLRFLIRHRVKYIYFSDRPISHWQYLFYKLAGVKKIIVHDHTPGERTRAGAVKQFIKRCRVRTPWYSADAAIGATEYVKHRLADVNGLPPEKCFAAPNGIRMVDESTANPADLHKQFQIPAGRQIIISTGRANYYKGVDFALYVVKLLVEKHRHTDIHYLYLGDGPHLDDFKRLAKTLEITDFVSFPGRVNNVAAILPFCTVAFHPSKGEVGYSLSILEYMAASLATVVPNNPSVCEATQDGVTGRIYQEGNTEDAASMISELISDKVLAAQMGLDALEDVKSRYTLTHCHKALTDALDQIIE